MMRTDEFLYAVALGGTGLMLATPAAAQEAAPAPAVTITGGATLATDYRFRGLSQTNKTVAVQATATIAHRSGAYASFWGSNIDDYVANGSDAELDLIAGYKHAFGGTTVDGGMLYYVYPGNGGADTDFFEPYANVSHAFGPVTAKLGGNFAWKQRGLALNGARHAGIYTYGELSATVPQVPVTVTGHLGHSFDRDYITFGERYTDWSVTAGYTFRAVTVSVAYVDTDKDLFSYPTGGGRDRDIAKGGVVGAVSFSF